MSHFSLLVIGDNPEEAIRPFIHDADNPRDETRIDWYRIGGRWSGFFKLKPGRHGVLGEHLSERDPPPDGTADSCFLGDIDGEIETTFSVVKDGKWYEHGIPGPFALVAKEKPEDEWEAEFRGLLDGLPANTRLTIIDFHQ